MQINEFAEKFYSKVGIKLEDKEYVTYHSIEEKKTGNSYSN